MDVNNIKVGDRIKFRAPYGERGFRTYTRTVTRVNPLIQRVFVSSLYGVEDYIVLPQEIKEHYPKGENS